MSTTTSETNSPNTNNNANRNRNRRRRKPRNPEATNPQGEQVVGTAGTALPPQTEEHQSHLAKAASPSNHRPRRHQRQGQAPEGQQATGQNTSGQQRQPHQARRNNRSNNKRGRNNNPEAIAPVMAPPNKGRTKRPLAEPRIGVGCIVLRGDEVLLVRERGRWSLPKGGLEVGELVQTGARRETYEETGLIVELRDLAFIVEFQAETWGHHLQFFYVGREIGGTLEPRDPDRDVQEAKFVPIRQLREYLRFRPRLVSLETWLRDRRPRHFVFDLDKEPAMLRKRRRIDMGRVNARRAEENSLNDPGDNLDDDEQP